MAEGGEEEEEEVGIEGQVRAERSKEEVSKETRGEAEEGSVVEIS